MSFSLLPGQGIPHCVSLSSNSLYLLTTISHRLVVSTESGAMMSELDETLKKALVCVRRLFNDFTVSLDSARHKL